MPESNEERHERDRRHVRRLLGIYDQARMPEADQLIDEALRHYHYYEDCVRFVSERLGVNRADSR